MLTADIALSMWAFLRVIDQDEPHPRWWAFLLAASLGVSLLLKSLIGVVFPIAAAVVYLAVTRQLFDGKIWRRLHVFSGTAIVILVAAPWHVIAALRNPPYFDLTMHSAPGEYHGFLWFFFMNEQVLRFLNLRYPRDYDTVPRLYFWLLHLLWLFPWSVYLPGGSETLVFASGQGWAGSAAGGLLDRLYSRVLHVLYHAGILFDAVLSRVGAPARFGDGHRRGLGTARNQSAVRDSRRLRDRGRHALVSDSQSARAGRYFERAANEPWSLYVVARAH